VYLISQFLSTSFNFLKWLHFHSLLNFFNLGGNLHKLIFKQLLTQWMTDDIHIFIRFEFWTWVLLFKEKSYFNRAVVFHDNHVILMIRTFLVSTCVCWRRYLIPVLGLYHKSCQASAGHQSLNP
jgi:hypothetical protein